MIIIDFRLNTLNLDIPKPSFSFVPGKEIEKCLDMYESEFDAMLAKLKDPLLNIFDVSDVDWAYQMKT